MMVVRARAPGAAVPGRGGAGPPPLAAAARFRRGRLGHLHEFPGAALSWQAAGPGRSGCDSQARIYDSTRLDLNPGQAKQQYLREKKNEQIPLFFPLRSSGSPGCSGRGGDIAIA